MTAFWIVAPGRLGPLGFGVIPHSLNDALLIIRAAGYGAYLPDDVGSLRITENVRVADLEHPYVRRPDQRRATRHPQGR